MPFADTDGSTLKVVEEATYGTTPANSANWKALREKGWNLKPKIQVVESEEISSSADVMDAVTVAANANWSLTGEYAKDATFEMLLEHTFRSAFATNVLKGGVLKNKSLTFEELTVATANEFAACRGCRVDSFSMSGSLGRIVETQFSGVGVALAAGATSLVGTGSVAAVGVNRALSLVDMTTFNMVGDVTPLVILDFNLQFQNNVREQFGAGSAAMQGAGYGTRRITGSFTAYFETREQMTKAIAGTKSDLSFTLSDGTNSHVWRIPALKYMEVDKPIGGRSTDITQTFNFLGTYNAGQATTVMVTRAPS
jgi:hypothetical protein